MKLFLAALVFGASITAANAQTATTCPVASGFCGFSITGVSPLTQQATRGLRFQRITNSSASTNLWCTRDPNATPAVNGADSYMIAAGASETFPVVAGINGPGYVPTAPTRCVPSSGTATGSVEIN